MEYRNPQQSGMSDAGLASSFGTPSAPANTTTYSSNNTPAARAKRPDPAAERLAEEMRVFAKVEEELRSKLNLTATREERYAQITHFATELFGVAPTWAAFYRAVMGKEGVIWTVLPDTDSRAEFETSANYGQILEMLTALRSRDLPENDPTEPQRMVTIRMPKSLYDVLCDESNQLKISVNKLCISRITQRLDPDVIPVTEKKRRGRRPGSAGQETSMPSKTETI